MSRDDFTCTCGHTGNMTELFKTDEQGNDIRSSTCPGCERQITVGMLDYVRDRKKKTTE
jgi:hypothetical protein